MTSQPPSHLKIDAALRSRLEELADRRGLSINQFAESVLRHYADATERREAEYADDEERWQRYLDSGIALSHHEVRRKLKRLAASAAKVATAQ